MRIAQIAPPHSHTPPEGFGGSELVVSFLTEELVRRGHEVVLFAHPNSSTRAELVTFPEVHQHMPFDRKELIHASRALEQAMGFDVVHNHCLSVGPALGNLADRLCLSTLHYVHPVARCFPEHPYVAISEAQRASEPQLNVLAMVHNGVDCSQYPLVGSKDDYVLFLGRIDPKKGPDLAIEVARELGARLVMAGPDPTEDVRDFFESRIRPHLGPKAEYVGEARGAQKLELLAHARCLLLPVRWEEPFGLVAIEAMACGTPVVALRRGALPEVVPHGEGGYVVDSLREMVAAAQRVDSLSPHRCRQVVEERFSAERMAQGYLGVYERLAHAHARRLGNGMAGPLRAAGQRRSTSGRG